MTTITVTEIISTVVQLLFMVLVYLISNVAIPFLKETKASSYITSAVKALEQMTTAANSGVEKKEQVITLAKEYLEKHNISMSDSQLEVIIESAVHQINTALTADTITAEAVAAVDTEAIKDVQDSVASSSTAEAVADEVTSEEDVEVATEETVEETAASEEEVASDNEDSTSEDW